MFTAALWPHLRPSMRRGGSSFDSRAVAIVGLGGVHRVMKEDNPEQRVKTTTEHC